MNISDLFRQFSELYPKDSQSQYRSSRSAEILKKDLPGEITEFLNLDTEQYRIYGSVGNGNWAEIPWLAILDRDITNTTTKGYYIVFLFDKNMKNIFLCLSLGWTQFEEEFGAKEGRIHISGICAHYAELLSTRESSFKSGEIDLNASHNLGKGYEAGSILYKKYRLDSIEDELIYSDLKELIEYYQSLKALVGDNILNIDIDPEQYNIQVQEFKKDISQSTFQPITDDLIASLIDKAEDYPPEVRERLIKQIVRNRKFANYIKQKANYTCSLCGLKPFMQKNGKPYAEADHINPLGQNGYDSPENMRCLCAQCHAIVTYGSEEEINKILI